MGIRIEFNKDIFMRDMLDINEYIAYTKYKEGALDSNDNEQNMFAISSNIKALIAYQVLRKSIEYTPVDTGKLRNSIYIKPYNNGFEIGYTCEYAIYVHEIGVNYHAYPTQYKYLEDAAFEVVSDYKADTGVDLNITIEYDPLRVFIGADNSPGESITGIKNNEQLLNDPSIYDKLLNDFLTFDYDSGSEADRAYYDKMVEFYNYYRNTRGLNTMAILREWVDRTRHK